MLNKKPASLIVHVGTNDPTNHICLLSNVKKIVNKTNKTSPSTVLSFFRDHFPKRQKESREGSGRYQFSVKKFLLAKKIELIANDNIKKNI